jgi:hypothetical protein
MSSQTERIVCCDLGELSQDLGGNLHVDKAQPLRVCECLDPPGTNSGANDDELVTLADL